LWNDKKVEICNPENERYNYLDVGNYQYDGVILLFGQQITSDIIRKIKLYWEKTVGAFTRNEFYKYQIGNRHAITLDEFNRIIDEYVKDRRFFQPPLNPELVEKGIRKIRQAAESKNLDVRISDEFIEIGDLKFGIEGKNLKDYLRLEIYQELEEILNPLKEIEFIVANGFYNGVEFIDDNEKHVIWVGNYSIEYH